MLTHNTAVDEGQVLTIPQEEQKKQDHLLEIAELGLLAGLYAILRKQKRDVVGKPEDLVTIVSDYTPAVVRELRSGMERAWQLGLGSAEAYLGTSLNTRLLNQEGLHIAENGSIALAQQLNARTIHRVQNIVIDWVQRGRPAKELATLLEPMYGRPRAEAIAITEMTNYHARAALRGYQSSSVVVGMAWFTANNDRVCFPAGTLVRTENGDRPIEQLKRGDKVLTRKGYKRIVATSKREYYGDMVRVNTPIGSVVSTADHPYWTQERGWVEAKSLSTELTLQTFEGASLGIHSLDFPFAPSHNCPAMRFEKPGFPFVLDSASVPVFPIDFKSDLLRGDQEVNAVASDLGLLDKLDTSGFKFLSGGSFKPVFSFEPAITGEATKVTVGAGNNSEVNPASLALSDYGRAAAFFRTVRAVEMLFGAEGFPASLANGVFGSGLSTGITAMGELVGLTPIHGERLPAGWASLGNFVNFGGVVAGSAAVHPSLFDLALAPVDNFAAGGAGDIFPVFELGSIVGHGYSPLTDNDELYRQSLGTANIVYDIQVEDEQEFYANGILVHNCPICAPLGGLIFDGESAQPTSIERQELRAARTSLYSTFTHPGGNGDAAKYRGLPFFPAAHVNCRCRIGPVVR